MYSSMNVCNMLRWAIANELGDLKGKSSGDVYFSLSLISQFSFQAQRKAMQKNAQTTARYTPSP